MHEHDPSSSPVAAGRWTWLSRSVTQAKELDHAVYGAIAGTPTPNLDRGLSLLSQAANYSRISIAAAAVLAATGGPRGREAAKMGLASVAVTSIAMNLGAKPIARRRRPDRVGQEVPLARHVRMPETTSFPSGHSAAAFAFATGVADVLPAAGFPLRGLAALVAYSRVHTGVHYPGDVLAGSLLGGAVAQATTQVLTRRIRRSLPASASGS
jgi:undecaprenyl-diphosphatase